MLALSLSAICNLSTVCCLLFTDSMKFIADVMLGKLAKKLRLRGFDVLYDRGFDDNEIIRIALAGNRIILTRDTALVARPLASNHILIKSDYVGEQICQVLSSIPGDTLPLQLSRCSECNEPLSAIAREETRDLVADYIYERHREFFRCGACGRIYWRGTHTQRMSSEDR